MSRQCFVCFDILKYQPSKSGNIFCELSCKEVVGELPLCPEAFEDIQIDSLQQGQPRAGCIVYHVNLVQKERYIGDGHIDKLRNSRVGCEVEYCRN